MNKALRRTKSVHLSGPTGFRICIALITLSGLILRLSVMPDYLGFFDSTNFVRALADYSIPEQRPHFPGYPVYIWLGRLVQLMIPDPVRALHVLSTFAVSFCVLPISYLTYDWRLELGGSPAIARAVSLFSALLWSLIPLSLIDGTEVFSDPLALLLALTLLHASWRTLSTHQIVWLIVAAFLGGLLLGVRLSYGILLTPILYVLWMLCKLSKSRSKTLELILVVGSAALAPTLMWFGWQLSHDGLAIFGAASSHLDGHYGRWGKSVITDADLWTRLVRFSRTFSIYSLGGAWLDTSALRFLASGMWTFFLYRGVTKLLRSDKRDPIRLLLFWIAPYTLWLIVSHDVELARYFLPLSSAACVIAAIGIPIKRVQGFATASVILLTLGFISLPLALEHRSVAPVNRQLSVYLTTHLQVDRGILLIAQENTNADSVIEELALTNTLIQYAPTFSLYPLHPERAVAQVRSFARQGRAVYLVSLPGAKLPTDLFHPKATFCRDPLVKSRETHQLTLYALNQRTSNAQALRCFTFEERISDVKTP